MNSERYKLYLQRPRRQHHPHWGGSMNAVNQASLYGFEAADQGDTTLRQAVRGTDPVVLTETYREDETLLFGSASCFQR